MNRQHEHEMTAGSNFQRILNHLLLIAVVLLLMAGAQQAHGQSGPQQLVRVTGDCELYFNFTATGTTASYDNRVKGCNYWVLYTAPSGVSAISLTVQGAQDNNGVAGTFANWTSSNVLLGTHPVVSANARNVQLWTSGSDFYPWVRINLGSMTGTGRVSGVLLGYRHTFAPVQSITSGTDGTTLVSAVACTNSTPFTLTTSGATQIVAASGSARIRICSISWSSTATSAQSLVSGTGSNCGTGTATQAGPYQTVQSAVLDFSALTPLVLPAGAAFCINQGTAVTTGGVVLYAQF